MSRKTIVDFINQLSQEARKVADDVQREEELLRLQELLKEYDGEDRVVSSLELARLMQERPPQRLIPSGYKGLDDILGGFCQKQVVVISAPTKSGKTSLCVELTTRMKDENPLWLPFEEPAEDLIRKFLDRGAPPPLFFTPERMTGNTLLWVEKKIIEAKAKYNSNVVFIDHLHFIVDFGENMSIQIGRTMRELKRLAKLWNVVIFLIAHLKKTRMDSQPDLEDLRDSSFIAQEADTVIMLWRESKRRAGQVVISNNVNVSVQANRRSGRTGNVQMVFEDNRFYERAWAQADTSPSGDDGWGGF